MTPIGRNDTCPCGSGKKFKKCHMGKETELTLDSIGDFTDEMSNMITSLPAVAHGRSREIVDSLDIQGLTGNHIGIKFIDLKDYSDLNLFGTAQGKASRGNSGGVFINLYKTLKTDPDNIYLAISHDIDDSTLIHELAHVLDYLGGSKLMPGTVEPLSLEMEIPTDHLEHPEEFGRWLDYLKNQFDIQLDADDTVIHFLYENGCLITGKAIDDKNEFIIKSKSEQIFRFLSKNSQKINELIKELPGYIGSREPKEE
jgi:hypothetical protein